MKVKIREYMDDMKIIGRGRKINNIIKYYEI
jgi:hypothetical protein